MAKNISKNPTMKLKWAWLNFLIRFAQKVTSLG